MYFYKMGITKIGGYKTMSKTASELELKQERLISSMDLGSSQLDLLHEILEIERELTLIEK